MENKIDDIQKSDNKNIDYSLYFSQPEKLITLAQAHIIDQNFDQGIDILKNSINYAQKKYGGENNIELVPFYNAYADGLIQEIMSSTDNSISISNIKEEPNEKNDIMINNINLPDSQIAFEYLNKANTILKKHLEQYNGKDPSTLNKEVIKYYLYLSENYNSFANLAKINLNFEKAIEYYKLSINYTKKYNIKFSRNLAALYFELAQILIYDPFNCLLSLYKSRVIMEYHLQQEITKANLDIQLNIDEKDLDLESISYNNEKINKNKELIETNVELNKIMEENVNIKEFVDIIKDINNKIQNVIWELKEYAFFVKNREQKEKGENNDGNIGENLDLDVNGNKLIMNQIKLVNIKRSEPSNNDDDIIKIEEDYSKEKFPE